MAGGILQVKERLDKNLPGSQLAKILDHFIYQGLNEVAKTSLFKDQLIEVIMYGLYHTRRKIASIDDKNEALARLFYAFFSPDPIPLVASVRLDRRILFEMLNTYNSMAKVYFNLLRQAVNEHDDALYVRFDSALNYNGELAVVASMKKVEAATRNAEKFRSMMTEKFIRLAYKKAKAAIETTKLTVDIDDLTANIIIGVINAINRYDHNKGSLVTHINLWMKDATNRPRNGHEMGVAFDIPAGQRKILLESKPHLAHNIAENVEDHTEVRDETPFAEEAIMHQQQEQFLAKLCNYADPVGYACLTLNIPVILKPEQIKLQQSCI